MKMIATKALAIIGIAANLASLVLLGLWIGGVVTLPVEVRFAMFVVTGTGMAAYFLTRLSADERVRMADAERELHHYQVVYGPADHNR